MAQTLQDHATYREKAIAMTKFQLMPSPLSDKEISEMEDARENVNFVRQNRENRISRFDEVPSSSKLESYRKKYRITQAKMAEMMGVSKRSFCDYESGETPIPFEALRKLAETTDFDFNELIVGDKSRASTDHCIHVIRQTREIVAYCLKYNDKITGAQAFAVVERYAIEYGLDGYPMNMEPDVRLSRIDDCIRSVTYDPEVMDGVIRTI